MTFRTSVTIVVSPRPRVGKTLVARLITDFHRHEGREVAAYDLNSGAGTLRRFLPEQTAAAGIGDIKGQMALFDALVAPDDVTRVVDLGHESFEAFFALAEKIGFADEAHGRGIAPAILFILTPDRTSIEAFRGLLRRFPAATVVPVHNEMFGASDHRDRYALSIDDPVVRLPVLAPALRKFVEVPPFSFADAALARATGIPLEAHIELQRWLRKNYTEFREIDLRILLADLRSSMTMGR